MKYLVLALLKLVPNVASAIIRLIHKPPGSPVTTSVTFVNVTTVASCRTLFGHVQASELCFPENNSLVIKTFGKVLNGKPEHNNKSTNQQNPKKKMPSG